jgi:hypothetical protein
MVRHREKKKGENGRKTGNNRRRQSGTAERRLDDKIFLFALPTFTLLSRLARAP